MARHNHAIDAALLIWLVHITADARLRGEDRRPVHALFAAAR